MEKKRVNKIIYKARFTNYNMKRRLDLIFVLMFIFCFSLVSAVSSGDINSSRIEDSYEVGDVLSGVINISLDNEFVSDDFYVKFSGVSSKKIDLYDFIDNQTAVSYTCSPSDCNDAYVTTGEALSSRSFSLQTSKLFGIEISGSSVEITDFKFDVSSNAQSNCNRQLSIDLFDDKTIDWVNDDFVSQTCEDELKSDCYTGSFTQKAGLKDKLYCEKINLTEAPGIKVNVGIAIEGSPTYENDLFEVEIYDREGTKLNPICHLSNPSLGTASCNLDYAVKEEDVYYLCVSLKAGSIEEGYKLKARTSPEGGFCGHASAPGDSDMLADYDITAYALKYASVGSFSFDKDEFETQGGGDLLLSIQDYIGEVYDMDCNPSCVIPIKFRGTSQDINLGGVSYSYSVGGNAFGPEDNFYEVTNSPAKVDMDYSLLSLDNAGIKVPQSPGNYTLEVFSGTTKLLEKDIDVSAKQISLISQVYPHSVAVLEERTFVAFLDSNIDLINTTFKWDFGDGDIITTNTNKVVKTLPSLKIYDCRVEVYQNSELLTSYDFEIESVSPKNAINKTLIKYKEYLDNIEDDLKSYSDDYYNIINIDTDDLRSQLESLEDDYNNLLADNESTDQEYVAVMSHLVSLNIPIAIQEINRATTRIVSGSGDISVEDIEDLFSEFSSGNEDKYANAIAAWSLEDKVELHYNLLSVFYVNGDVDNVITEYRFDIDSELENVYAIIEEGKDFLIFDSNYDVYSSGSDLTGVNIDLRDSNEFSFAVEGEYNLFDLDIYFSPMFDDLSTGGEIPEVSKKSSKLWMIVIVIIFLILFSLVAYIFLLRYYKFKYEAYLFKNPRDLYNLMSFIKIAKSKGKSDKEIREKLLKAKWSNEQISYAMKKVKGEKIIWEPSFLKRFTEKKDTDNENVKKGGYYSSGV